MGRLRVYELGCWARRDDDDDRDSDDLRMLYATALPVEAGPYVTACGRADVDRLGLCPDHRARYDREVLAVAPA